MSELVYENNFSYVDIILEYIFSLFQLTGSYIHIPIIHNLLCHSNFYMFRPTETILQLNTDTKEYIPDIKCHHECI